MTDSVWKSAEIKVEFVNHEWVGNFEACNAVIVSFSKAGRSVGLVGVRYADNTNRLSADRGHIIVRPGGKGVDFSFFVDDVLGEGAVYVRDIDAFAGSPV